MSLSDHEIERLAKAGEAERVERKASAKQKQEIRDAICAFANDLPAHRAPGLVLVGLNDDGSPSGIAITDELLRALADLRSDGNILPLPTMSVEKRLILGNELAVIEVQPSLNPPVRLRGRTMIRVGTRRGIASLEEERRLAERARSQAIPFDLQQAPGARISDLDIEFLRTSYIPAAVSSELLAQNNRSFEVQLEALKILTADGTPTNLGVLVAAADPTSFLPGAYIQFIRFDGKVVDIVIRDEKRGSGSVLKQITDIEHVLELNSSTELDLSTGVEVRRPDYPMTALRELIRNAVIHRTYDGTSSPVRIAWFDDRIEITSPGGPYGSVTKDNFGSAGILDHRNPNLVEAMRHLGFAQRFGIGLVLAQQALAKNGNPKPVLQATDTHIHITVRRRS